MYYYFSCEYPSVLKINGMYFGSVFNTVKHVSVHDGDAPAFIEICPLIKSERQTNALLDKNFLTYPPNYVQITDLNGGYLIKFTKSYFTDEFKVIAQQKYADALITVFCENGYKLSVETANDFYVEQIKFTVESVEISRIEQFSQPTFAIIMSGANKLVNVYRAGNDVKKIFSKTVYSVNLENGFVTVEKLKDIAKHEITTEWTFSEQEVKPMKTVVNRAADFQPENLPTPLIPFAFCEELLVGGRVDDFLDENIVPHKDKLCGYTGEFIGVMPPPIFRSDKEVGLIYKTGENIYKAEYFTFDLNGKKITNIKKSE